MIEQATGTRPTCKYPGCENPPAPATKPGRPPGFCELEEHDKLSAWRERQRLDAEARGDVVNEAQQAEPVTYSLTAGAELLRQVRAAGERQRTDIDRLIAHLNRLADPTSSEVEVATARTEFQENIAAAERRATAADRRALTAEEARDLANGAAEEMARHAEGAEHRARQATDQLAAATTEYTEQLEAARADAERRVTAAEEAAAATSTRAHTEAAEAVRRAEADADAAVRAAETRIAETERQAQELASQARADAEALVRASETDRDRAREQAEQHRQAA